MDHTYPHPGQDLEPVDIISSVRISKTRQPTELHPRSFQYHAQRHELSRRSGKLAQPTKCTRSMPIPANPHRSWPSGNQHAQTDNQCAEELRDKVKQKRSKAIDIMVLLVDVEQGMFNIY
jgi:hypothetical protein